MLSADSLVSLGPFRDAPREAAVVLARVGRQVIAAPDDVIFRAGSAPRGWYVVIRGGVRVLRIRGGRTHVVHTESAGGTLGEVPLFAGGTHPATAVATEPTTLALFDWRGLEQALAESPAVARMLLRSLALRVRGLVERLDSRSARSVSSRLASFILQRPASPARGVTLGLTLAGLAEELGTVREVVSRELLALKRRGFLESRGGGRYLVIDHDALRALADE